MELFLYDAYDQYGHLYTSKYLPDFSLDGMQLEFDLALTGCMNPISPKFPSIPWNAISYITPDETFGAVPLPSPVSTVGEVAASCSLTVSGTPTNFDQVQIVYLGNTLFSFICDGTERRAGILNATIPNSYGYVGLVAQINTATSSVTPLTAKSSGAVLTITCTQPGRDGNSIQLTTMYKAAGSTKIYPTGTVSPSSGLTAKLTGGTDPTSQHYRLNFTALGIPMVRQIWLTLAPQLTYNSGATNSTLVAFTPTNYSAVFTNWTVLDPLDNTPLYVAGPGSVVVGSQDEWATYSGSGWVKLNGQYFRGYAAQSSNAGDSVIITYSCESIHDLYLGTQLLNTNGQFSVSLDGGQAKVLSCYALTTSNIPARLPIAFTLSPEAHTIYLTVQAGAYGSGCLLDYIQASVSGNPVSPATTYMEVGAAADFDTQETQYVPPVRLLKTLSLMGLNGDLDFYCGVLAATLKRVRNGGYFPQATISLTGALGSTDSFFVDISGLSLGAQNLGLDTFTTLAQRLVGGINATFVGVCAIPTATPGQFTVTVLSPINGFTISVSKGAGSTGNIALSGGIGTGNEGTWGADSTQTSPLNPALTSYLSDLAVLLKAAGQTMTAAFSMEILEPPDANTALGAWSQRYLSGLTVLTSTGLGTWGAGLVNGLSGGIYTQTGHGYVTGTIGYFSNATQSGSWILLVTGADTYTLGTQLSNSGGYTPAIGDSVLAGLQTTQCTFNPATVAPYLGSCYVQAANIMAAAGLIPWLQFGEILWWFFSQYMSEVIGFASFTSPISIGTVSPHNLATGQTVIVAGVQGNTAANGTWTFVETDSTHGTLTGSAGNGAYVAGTGTISGGGMAFYDAWAASASHTALGRDLGTYYTQDDAPDAADTAWLRGAIAAHVASIVSTVLAAQAGAKFELLYPTDVTAPAVYWNSANPYPQGGRLNTAVDFPAAYESQSGSGLDRLKIEALSWGSQYRNYDNIKLAIQFPATSPNAWAAAQTAYLLPIFNGGCPYPKEYLYALGRSIPLIVLFAVDHLVLLDWPFPLPINGNLGTTP